MNENQELKFAFTVKTANLILQALSGMPYAQVVDVIADMQKQAGAQMNAAPVSDAANL